MITIAIVSAVVVVGGALRPGLLEIAMGAVVAVGVVGISVWSVRLSARARVRQNEQVSATNNLLREVARVTELKLLEGGVHPHPVVGDLRLYDRLCGEVRGQSIRLEVNTGDVEDSHRLLILASPPPGRSFPKLGRIDGRRGKARPELAARLAPMEGRVVEVRVEPDELRVVAKGASRAFTLMRFDSPQDDLPCDAGEVIALVEATATLAASLTSIDAPPAIDRDGSDGSSSQQLGVAHETESDARGATHRSVARTVGEPLIRIAASSSG